MVLQAWNEQRCWDQSHQSCSGIKSTLERKLVSAESKPHTSSRLPPMTFKDVWVFAAGHLTARELSFPSENTVHSSRSPKNRYRPRELLWAFSRLPHADILGFLVLEKHNFCEFPHQIISVTLCPSRLEMLRAVQWHSGFGAAWKHMVLIKITSTAVAEHSNLTPRGGGISPVPSDDTILGAAETSLGHLTHAQFGIKKGDWIYNIHELHYYYYYYFTR